MAEESWLENRWESFQVGAWGLVDAVLGTDYAAEADAEIAAEDGELGGQTQEEREDANSTAEQNGALGEAWQRTEADISNAAASVTRASLGTILALAILVAIAFGWSAGRKVR